MGVFFLNTVYDLAAAGRLHQHTHSDFNGSFQMNLG